MTATTTRILIADDEAHLRDILTRVLGEEGYAVSAASGGREACTVAEREQVHLALVDLTMPDGSELDVLTFIRERLPETRVIMMTAFATAETAVEAMKLGALDYLIKPFALDELKLHVRRAVEELTLAQENRLLRREVERRKVGATMVGAHSGLLAAQNLARRAADDPSTVLITGETGTGKELIARLLHSGTKARPGPFVAVNCAAIPENLLERELFGHERGAYTGADSARAGLLEAADNGTLFLDEIGEMPPAMQAKLLRVIDGHEFQRVGGTRPIRCRVRFVAATNKDLAKEVKAGRFRQDLYFRLNVVTIALPPLRERGDDVLRIADRFLEQLAADRGRPLPKLTEAARAALHGYPWPGNVRELQNVLERAVLVARTELVDATDLSLTAGGSAAAAGSPAQLATLPYREARDAFELAYLTSVLAACGGVVTQAAARMGLDRRNLQIKLKRLGVRFSD